MGSDHTRQAGLILTECARSTVEQRVDELYHNVLRFTKPWDMEPCATAYPFDVRAGNWEESPNGDPEWVYMLNRMDYLEDLAAVVYADADQRACEHMMTTLYAWSRDHTPLQVQESTRTLDTGMRLMSWTRALIVFDWYVDHCGAEHLHIPVPAAELRATIQASMAEQYAYLREHYLTRYETSNWGLIQSVSIVFGYLMGMPVTDELFVWAMRCLSRQIRAQVLPDGVHWEQSVMYHAEVLRALLDVLVVVAGREDLQLQDAEAARLWVDLAAQMHEAAYQMTYALEAMMPSTNMTEPWGDSDVKPMSCLLQYAVLTLRALDVRALEGSHVTPVICVDAWPDLEAAQLLAFATAGWQLISGQQAAGPGADQARYQHYMSYLQTCGSESPYGFVAPRLAQLIERGAAFRAVGMTAAGLFTTQDAAGNFSLFTHGPLGSGHGHCDNLHLSVTYRGRRLLCDSGRYTYREDEPLRVALKARRAHNVPVSCGASSCVPSASWDNASFGTVLPAYWATSAYASYVEGSLLEYNPTRVITRKMLTLFFASEQDDAPAPVHLVLDQCYGGAVQPLTSYWHLGAGYEAYELPQTSRFLRRYGLVDVQGQTHLVLHSMDMQISDEHINQGLSMSTTVSVEETAQASEVYNQYSEHHMLSTTTTGFNPIAITVIAEPDVEVRPLVVSRGGTQAAPGAMAHAFEIQAAGMRHAVALFHAEPYTGRKVFELDGIPFHASVAVATRMLDAHHANCEQPLWQVLKG